MSTFQSFIKQWSLTPASNGTSPNVVPFGWPEGMPPSAVNDTARQNMTDHRYQWEDAEWFCWGDTVSRASAITFKIAADVTSRYLNARRIKCLDAGTTLYGTVISSSYSAPDTTITVTLDSGSLTASLSAVALALLTPTSQSITPNYTRKGADIASATTTDLSTAAADFVDVTGTTTITGLGTCNAGVVRTLRFTGALTLTHNATSLILPGAANIVTAANDTAIFRSLGSSNWLCITYKRASGIGSYELIQAQTASNSATLDFTVGITSAYSNFVLLLDRIAPATDNQALFLRFSANGGVSYLAGTEYQYAQSFTDTTGTATNAGQTGVSAIRLTGLVGNDTYEQIIGEAALGNLAVGSLPTPKVSFIGSYRDNVSLFLSVRGAGECVTTSVNAFRILFGSGNIASGTAYLYGVR